MSEEKPRDTETFLALARKRFAAADESERTLRQEFEADIAAVAGDQWTDKVKREREDAGRPVLTFNKLPSFTQAIANEARKNKNQIKLSPVDSSADPDTADVWEGLTRHIQYDSDASVAYETALDYSCSGSFGYLRLLSDYTDNRSMTQELKIGCIDDPLSVYGVLMPACLGQKVPWAFIVSTLTREEYEAKYPDSEVVSLNFEGEWDHDWIEKDSVRIAEYWYIERKKKTLVQLADGTTAYEDELKPGAQLLKDPETGKPQKRQVSVDKVRFCTINGVEILEDDTEEGKDDPGWPDPDGEIPIVAVLGKKLIVDRKPRLFSVIRFARDPQKLYNYYKTGIAEQLSLASRSPYVGYLGAFKSKAKEWQTANTRNYAYLEADPVMVGGQPAPLPQRQVYEPPIQALSQGAAQESDDMKATTSIFDASLGAQGNETSGIAIQRRQRQASIGNYHFLDNLTRAYRTLGRMIVRLIPYFYDTPREIQILGPDEAQKVVKVNQQFLDEDGQLKLHRLDVGKYDVVVTTGPEYNTARDEAFDMMTQFATAYPPLLQIAGDIVFRNSNMPGADELSERFKAMLPPQLQEQPKGGPQIPPEVQNQMQQLGQQHDALVQAVHGLQNQLESKNAELDLKRYTVDEQEKTKRVLGLAQLNSREALSQLEHELQITHNTVDRSHEANMKFADFAHEAALQAADHGQKADLQAQQLAHAHALQQMAAAPQPQPNGAGQQDEAAE